jgi:carbonic anhydrase
MKKFNGFVGRRDLLKILGISGIATATAGLGLTKNASAATLRSNIADTSAHAPSETPSETPDTAMTRLMAGNQRFVSGQTQHPQQSLDRVQELAQSQNPFAIVLGCADSRVPGEVIFDQGLGNIFDIRVAGNIVTPEVIGSIEYAVAYLKTPLLVVLGHERCGAVSAAVQGGEFTEGISSLVKAIAPAVARVKGRAGNAVENVVVANIQYQVEKLQQSSPMIQEAVRTGKLKIVGGRYDLDEGTVTLV